MYTNTMWAGLTCFTDQALELDRDSEQHKLVSPSCDGLTRRLKFLGVHFGKAQDARLTCNRAQRFRGFGAHDNKMAPRHIQENQWYTIMSYGRLMHDDSRLTCAKWCNGRVYF